MIFGQVRLMQRRIRQVIAPMLIIQRVANKSALTSNDVVHGWISEFEAKNQEESTGDGGSLPSGDPMTSSVGECGKNLWREG